MSDTIFKTFRAEVKGVNANEGTVDLMIPVSTASVDRDGEIVEPTAFKKTLPKFMKRPVLVSSHDYRDLTSQIGEWTKLKITDSGVEGKPKYYINEGNEQADWGFKLASKGMAAFSIGFIPKEWEDGDGVKTPKRTYKEVELLEISQVIVPSNREAIQGIRSKGFDNEVVNKLLDDVLADKELITKPEETDEYIRIPVDTGDHKGHRIRNIDISEKEGISAVYCGTDKVIMTYLFSKDEKYGWTMAKAKEWVKEHEKSVIISTTSNSENDDEIIMATIQTDDIILHSPRSGKTSQEEIIDEIDYLKTLIEKEGLSEEAKEAANELLKVMCTPELLKRILGSDIPVDIKEPVSQIQETAANTVTMADIQEAIGRIAKT